MDIGGQKYIWGSKSSRLGRDGLNHHMYGLSERQDKMDVVILTDKGAFRGEVDDDDNLTLTSAILTTEEFLSIRHMTDESNNPDIQGYIGGCPANCASHS